MKSLREAEREYVLKTLVHFNYDRSIAASSLKVSIKTLGNYIRELKAEGHYLPTTYEYRRITIGKQELSPQKKEKLNKTENLIKKKIVEDDTYFYRGFPTNEERLDWLDNFSPNRMPRS